MLHRLHQRTHFSSSLLTFMRSINSSQHLAAASCRLHTSALNKNIAPSTTSSTSASAPAPILTASSLKKPKKSTLRIIRADASGWEVIIGIELHAQITTASKIFSGASTQFGAQQNTHVSLVDAALPGTLPVLNAHAVSQAIRTGLGLRGQVQRVSKFERKHYFYADMPQGYQITQQQFPIVRGGSIQLSPASSSPSFSTASSSPRSIRITRIQLEQDSGKSLHDLSPTHSYVDLNRCGVGLMEIVSEPDIRSSEEAAMYIRKITNLLQALGTCRAHMEDGSLRADVNVSIRRTGSTTYGERVEIKNLNSLRSVQRAIEFEIARQIGLYTSGSSVARETRGFDAKSGETVLMRSKENMLDYRFAPEPDLPPLILRDADITHVSNTMPELPDEVSERLSKEYGLSSYDIQVLQSEPGAVEYMDQLVLGEGYRRDTKTKQQQKRQPKRCVNWLCNELFGRLKKMRSVNTVNTQNYEEDDEDLSFDDDSTTSSSPLSFSNSGSRSSLSLSSSPVSSTALGELIDLVESEKISGKVAKDVLDLLMVQSENENRKTPLQIVQEKKWMQVTDFERIDSLCSRVLLANPAEVLSVQQGNKRLFGFLSGQVLKLAKEEQSTDGGQLNPAQVSKRLMQAIEAARTK